ncbi:O-antigen ligase family protein [Cronobacter dublinensis]|nr:O-antigen ligase family protein [Cronobacter dublinensis]
MISKNVNCKTLYLIAFLFMLVSLYFLIFDAVHARKVFYTAGYASIAIFLFSLRKKTCPKKNLLPILSAMAFSLTILVWLFIFHNKGEYWEIYNSYETSGKILLLMAILLLIYSNTEIIAPGKVIDSIFIIGGISANLFAVYQYNTSLNARIELGFDRATMAAYIITIVDILMIHAVLNRHGLLRYVLFALTVTLAFSAIIFTSTRAAIMSFPFLCLFQAFTHPNVNKKHLLNISLSFLCLLAVAIYAFQKPLEKRWYALLQDIHSYENNHSVTSVGARFAMYHTGLQAGLAAPLGQSAESRGAAIKEMVQSDKSLAGALPFIDVHLHNEVVDNFSLRGIMGVLALVAMYGSLLWSSWRDRNPTLFVLTLSLILYGLSDAIFFSREGTIAYAIGILTALVFLRRSEKEKHEPNTLRQK